MNMFGELPTATALIEPVPVAFAAAAAVVTVPKALVVVVAGGVAGEVRESELVSVIGLSEVPRPPPFVFPKSVIASPLLLLFEDKLLVEGNVFVPVEFVMATVVEFDPPRTWLSVSANSRRAVSRARSLSSPIRMPGQASVINALPKAVVALGRNMKVKRLA